MNEELMNKKKDEHRQLNRLERLAKTSSTRLFSLSPNDVLVQVALPLVLILAIATRLMMMTARDEGPVILELWKQQLILRIEWVLDKWEKESGLSMFPEFERVKWSGAWPEDPRYQRLCENGKELAHIENLKLKLYQEALEYRPENVLGEARENASPDRDVYESEVSDSGHRQKYLWPELTINEERRQYALQYIEQRCLRWKTHLEDLQWSTIEKTVAQLPIGDKITDKNLSVQMNNLAQAFEGRGYHLLSSIVDEYKQKEQVEKQ